MVTVVDSDAVAVASGDGPRKVGIRKWKSLSVNSVDSVPFRGISLSRNQHLEAPGLVVEFETLPPMTENPAWGIELTRILLDGMARAHAKRGLKSVLRITPNDTREMERPPRMRSGPFYEEMLNDCPSLNEFLQPAVAEREPVRAPEIHDQPNGVHEAQEMGVTRVNVYDSAAQNGQVWIRTLTAGNHPKHQKMPAIMKKRTMILRKADRFRFAL